MTIEILESGLNQDLQRRVIDDESVVYLVYGREEGPVGQIIGRTPGSPYKVWDYLPEYEKIEAAFKKSYFDRIPEFEQWKNSQGNMIPEPEPFATKFFSRTNDGGFLVSVPVPPIPKYPWDTPNYSVNAYAVQIIPPTIFNDFNVFADRVRLDVKKSIIMCVVLGVLGLLLILSILAAMSKVLTQPLTWLMTVGRKVVNNHVQKGSRRSVESNFGEGHNRDSKRWNKRTKKKRSMFSSTTIRFFSEDNNTVSSVIVDTDSVAVNNPPPRMNHRDLEAEDDSREYDDGNKVGFVNFDYHPEDNESAWFILSTELQQLLEAFQSMIHGFSGDGISEVAEPGLCEIQNDLTWRPDFSKLYEGHAEAKGSFKKLSSMRQISGSTRTTIGSIEGESQRSISVRQISGSTIASHHCTQTSQIDGKYENFEQTSIPFDQPDFCSSPIHDQDSSGESSPRPQQDIRTDRIEHVGGIRFPGPPPGSKTRQTIVPAPLKVNLTSTLGSPEFELKPIFQNRESPSRKIKTACSSRLFWWIVVLMVSSLNIS